MDSWINPHLKSHAGLFNANGYVSIPNFLKKEKADALAKYFNKEIAPDWWYCCSLKNNQKIIHQNTPDNQLAISNMFYNAQRNYLDGRFSYVFYRTYGNHYNECDCMECIVRKSFRSPEFISQLNHILGIKLNTNNELFVSKYTQNCFLNTHTDKGNGRIAFVLNLTKEWSPEYGGCFYLLDQDRHNIRRVIMPTFNTLTIFNIPPDTGIPHFVGHVNADKSRIAISGWYS